MAIKMNYLFLQIRYIISNNSYILCKKKIVNPDD